VAGRVSTATVGDSAGGKTAPAAGAEAAGITLPKPDRKRSGNHFTAAAAINTSNVPHTTGRPSQLQSLPSPLPDRSRNGAFRPLLTCCSLGAAPGAVEIGPTPPLVGAATGAAATSLGAPAAIEAPAAPAPAALKPAGSALLAVKVSGESWVEVQDARGQTLLSRKVAAGESLGLDGEVPLRLTIGNATATQITFRGQPVDLSANTVANVARLQLN
jgi:Domain of unknown function (DUF4115)